MPNICHIYKLVHVQILGKYFPTCASYKLTGINSVTKNTTIYTLNITRIYPRTNMATTLHMFHCTATVIYIQTPHKLGQVHKCHSSQ